MSKLQQRFQLYPAGGDTKFGIRDMTLGRLKNGKPVGVPVIRFDQADKITKYPHININPQVMPSGFKDPHTSIPGGAKTLKVLGTAGKTLEVLGRIAKPVAIVTDAVRIGNAVSMDGNTIGKNTIKTSASVAGGWGGALAGATVGVWFGVVGAAPGAAIGGFIGAIGGGIAGAFGGSWVSKKIANKALSKY